jgi:hypothetical protein
MTQPPVPQLPQLQGSGDDPPGPPVVTAVKRRNQSELNIAEARARQPSVRADVGAMAGDLGTMMSALQAVLHGNANGVYQVSSAGDAVIGESTSLIPLCTP